MTKPITREMFDAWTTLQDFARRVQREPTAGALILGAAKAIDILDNSDFMGPIEQAGLCGYQTGGGYLSPPEYCELEVEGAAEYCPRHQELADENSNI